MSEQKSQTKIINKLNSITHLSPLGLVPNNMATPTLHSITSSSDIEATLPERIYICNLKKENDSPAYNDKIGKLPWLNSTPFRFSGQRNENLSD
ncbi:hypothetical protein COBT_003793 [Conglomerata obtusa]